MNYLNLYKTIKTRGKLQGGFGLCREIADEMGYGAVDRFKHTFKPTMEEIVVYGVNEDYWGSENRFDVQAGILNPTRETMLLLMAAYEGEL
jgi:hypothetical protein